ncbi:hypothetical protein [Glycomyces sp. NRRL B-16210]|uniref:hypothetical protein n=1 Tax=Glycomyces sp. NRRL B-16210 TaxID=1463821 RepID=UPI0010606E0D|nr:hypothetical protein [Glycomyces sp. NRRL B-16210]
MEHVPESDPVPDGHPVAAGEAVPFAGDGDEGGGRGVAALHFETVRPRIDFELVAPVPGRDRLAIEQQHTGAAHLLVRAHEHVEHRPAGARPLGGELLGPGFVRVFEPGGDLR